MPQRFANHVVWITGGGSGLGKELALACAREGARVAVSGRRVERLEAVVAEIAAAGGQGLAVPCDVTIPQQVEAAVEQTLAKFGQLDVAIANAGFGVAGRIRDLQPEDWQRQMAVNVIGLTTTIRCALPHLEQTGGRMVLIGSVAAYVGIPGSSAYGASKAAVRYIGASLSAELAGSGVTCTTIHPGFVESEIAQVDNQGQFRPDRTDRRPQAIMWPTDRAAAVMLRAIHRRRREFVFTGHGHFIAFLGQRLPRLTQWLITRFAGKRSG